MRKYRGGSEFFWQIASERTRCFFPGRGNDRLSSKILRLFLFPVRLNISWQMNGQRVSTDEFAKMKNIFRRYYRCLISLERDVYFVGAEIRASFPLPQ